MNVTCPFCGNAAERLTKVMVCIHCDNVWYINGVKDVWGEDHGRTIDELKLVYDIEEDGCDCGPNDCCGQCEYEIVGYSYKKWLNKQ